VPGYHQELAERQKEVNRCSTCKTSASTWSVAPVAMASRWSTGGGEPVAIWDWARVDALLASSTDQT
jgi:hypothetical protein